jgi:hypothetical protein
MLPTDEERAKIQEAQLASPELPLGSAEQFLLSLASITELAARLKLWLFKSDYENMEKVTLLLIFFQMVYLLFTTFENRNWPSL